MKRPTLAAYTDMRLDWLVLCDLWDELEQRGAVVHRLTTADPDTTAALVAEASWRLRVLTEQRPTRGLISNVKAD